MGAHGEDHPYAHGSLPEGLPGDLALWHLRSQGPPSLAGADRGTLIRPPRESGLVWARLRSVLAVHPEVFGDQVQSDIETRLQAFRPG